MRRNILWCWCHLAIFSAVFFIVSIVWPKWLHQLKVSGLKVNDAVLFNKIYPVFQWFQENLIIVLWFIAVFSLDLFVCSFIKTFKSKVVWTALLSALFVIVAVISSIVFKTTL